MDIISIKDIVEEEVESDNRYYAVKKPIELFCGLYTNDNFGKFEIYFGERMKINKFLPQINEYLSWIKEDKNINTEMENKKVIKINYGVVGIEENGNKKSMFLCENEKGRTIWLETEEGKYKIGDK